MNKRIKILFTETRFLKLPDRFSERANGEPDRYYVAQMALLPPDVPMHQVAVLHMERRTRRDSWDDWTDPSPPRRVLIDVPYIGTSEATLIRRAIADFDAFIAEHEAEEEAVR